MEQKYKLHIHIVVTEIEKEGEHWRRCTFYTNKAMGLTTGAVYVNATSSHMPLQKVRLLVDNLTYYNFTIPISETVYSLKPN